MRSIMLRADSFAKAFVIRPRKSVDVAKISVDFDITVKA